MSASLKDAILAHDRPVPRYTSYPTAPHFQDGMKAATYESWLGTLPADELLSLYVHTPFCQRLCWFCGCNTRIVNAQAPVEEYAQLLEYEAQMVARLIPEGVMVRHLHFGGGSPTIIAPRRFGALMSHLRKRFAFAKGADVAVEIDPRSFNEARAASYAAAGVTRMSIGVQDFDDKVMQAVNRPQPFHTVYDAAALARSYDIARINIDLMYGLPYQTPETMARLIDQALILKPDRIALFGYAHVPWMKRHMRLIPEQGLPDASLRYDLFEQASAALEAAGYVAIGIDHFARADDSMAVAAREGRLRRNFQGYTTDAAGSLIGLGASSIGQLPQGYVQNTPHIPPYRERIQAGRLPVEKFRVLSADDRLRGAIIERLMCDMHVHPQAVAAMHGHAHMDFSDAYTRLQPLVADGLVSIDKHIIHVHARQAVRLAAAAFDAYLPQKAAGPRHSAAV